MPRLLSRIRWPQGRFSLHPVGGLSPIGDSPAKALSAHRLSASNPMTTGSQCNFDTRFPAEAADLGAARYLASLLGSTDEVPPFRLYSTLLCFTGAS